MKKLLIAFALTSVVTNQAVHAKTINKRQQNQANRIGQGINSGQLTGLETKRLIKQQANIAHKERQFKSDGQFTRKERVRVQHMQNHASTQIFKQKHDKQTR